MKMTNIEIFDYSINHPEPLVDDFYVKSSELIISDLPHGANRLMKINRELLENITAYRLAMEKDNSKMQEDILENVQSLMKNDGLNFSEFASFWAVVDVSYSLYCSLPSSEQLKFLRSVIEKYLKMRHQVYLNHGYSATTLQASKDAKSHKSSGTLGINKVASLLKKKGYIQLSKLDVHALEDENRIFLFSDKDGKKLFQEALKVFRIDFSWSLHKQNKMPDIFFKSNGDIYIVEHKHMKEGGGGQDKQVAEVVDFISYSEKKSHIPIHYIVFMDGLYFNLFMREDARGGKLVTQIDSIRKKLKIHRENYFVNTAGFCKLLDQIG